MPKYEAFNSQSSSEQCAKPSEYSRHKYHTLDCIRGIAAIVVVVAHTSIWFGGFSFAEGYLAVDLFFVLSGFVIAEAYSVRLQSGSLSFKSFATIRIIRLYPLYILGSILGAIVKIGKNAKGIQDDLSSDGLLGWAVAFALFMLPSPFVASLYPLNGPSWSLFFEIVANAAYAILRQWLSIKVLVWTAIISAVTLSACVINIGHLNVGFSWGAAYVGFPRVFFSFCVGLLVHSYRDRFSISIPSYLIILTVLCILSMEPSEFVRPYYDLVVVLCIFPLVVLIGAANEPNAGLQTNIYVFLGEVSYTLYVLHVPIAWLLRGLVLSVTGKDVSSYAPIAGFLLFPVLLGLGWVLGRVYDQPIRRKLLAFFVSKEAR